MGEPVINKNYNEQVVSGSFTDRQKSFIMKKQYNNSDLQTKLQPYSFQPKLCSYKKTNSIRNEKSRTRKSLYMQTEPSYNMEYFSNSVHRLLENLNKEDSVNNIQVMNISDFQAKLEEFYDKEEHNQPS